MRNFELLKINEQPEIRRAKKEDVPLIVKLAIDLGRQHSEYDAKRFDFADFEPIEVTYTDFFSAQLQENQAVILVAELSETIVGYAYIRFEPKSFVELLNAGAWLHDIYFDENVRGKGIGKRFFEEIIKAAKSLGSDSLMLSVSPHNTTAQKFFEQNGFRPTMQEMRLDF